MESRMLFDEYASNYEKHRSVYVRELFDDLFAYSRCGKNTKALEVGCGTGQATSWVVQTGCLLKAVEIGENLCRITHQKLAAYNNLEIINLPFEACGLEDDSLDLVYSASAFHWIPEEIGYPKVYKALKPGGSFAVFGCPVEISPRNQALKDEIEALERGYFPKTAPAGEDESAVMKRVFESYGFKSCISKSYSAYRTLSADDFIGLLLSVSSYHELGDRIRDSLLVKIHQKILEYGAVEVHDRMNLHMCRK